MERPKTLVMASMVLLFLGIGNAPTTDRVFWGERTDSLCAQMGSHETTTRGISSSRECTIGCVEAGAKYVLYNARWRTALQLDDQQVPRKFAGEQVIVIGTYDRETNTIHVKYMQPVYEHDRARLDHTAEVTACIPSGSGGQCFRMAKN
jgi:hypothetical protein